MNKSEVIEAITAQTDLSKAAAGRALNAAIGAIIASLKDGESVSLVGFGNFSVKTRAARIGRNPQSGAAIQIAAANIPGFKASKALKDVVNYD
jgi:DNA-binding protein HU-beta